MNVILLEASEIDGTGHAVITGGRAAHVTTVLKARRGDTIRVGLLDGPLGSATVLAVEAARTELQCTFESTIPPRPDVDLLLALPRPKVMRRLWAQLATVGVGRIILTNAERVERNYFDTHVLTRECYHPLLVEGLQQARDTRLPAVSIHRQFRVLVEDELDVLSDAGIRIAADPGGGAVAGVVSQPAHERVLLAVGPEGGWNAFERSLLEARGFVTVSIGPRPLRSDTACIALLSVVHEAIRRRRV